MTRHKHTLRWDDAEAGVNPDDIASFLDDLIGREAARQGVRIDLQIELCLKMKMLDKSHKN